MQPQLALISRAKMTPTLKDANSDWAFSLDFIRNDLINKTWAFGKTIITGGSSSVNAKTGWIVNTH